MNIFRDLWASKKDRFYDSFHRAKSFFKKNDFEGASIAAQEAIAIEQLMSFELVSAIALVEVYKILAASLYRIGDKDGLISAKVAIDRGVSFAQSTGERELQLGCLRLQASILEVIQATEELRLAYKNILRLDGDNVSALIGLVSTPP